MTDHLHGLCKNCIPNCSQILNIGRKEGQCNRCREAQPSIIVEEEGLIVAICTKCYLKQQASPKKSQYRQTHSSTLTKTSNFIMISKPQLLNKGFFSSEGKMARKIQKYFSKFQTCDDAFKDMIKKSIVPAPLTWQKMIQKCEKTGSIMYVFVSKSHIFGCYHLEVCKVGDKDIVDNESGFFMSQRSKIDLQYYKANQQNVVIYNSKTKSIAVGKPHYFQIFFQGEIKIRCDLVTPYTQWIYHFVIKL